MKTTRNFPNCYEDIDQWKSILTGQTSSHEEILMGMKTFMSGSFENMYEYLCFYLKKDVLVLNFVFWKIFNSWHSDGGPNFIVKRIFTLSHLVSK
jgi:hypothetical protein